ncbi:baculoviral IAP repeat-containing protein 6-like isoform X1 [Montipora foliosa]|uniref:baculoviral IAP repeat-containing protein 6-like isoform X1 n=1 Tax=Montipora foliosa TaxID=591990 RepID=UPI0035F11D1F
MAAPEEWYIEEEGCLKFSGRPISVTFSPPSNCFICTLEDGTVEVVDARSNLQLKRTTQAVSNGPLQCRFCPEVEKLFLTNGSVSGLRKDLNGILLLDSILQPPLEGASSEEVVLEVTLSDALQLISAMDLYVSESEDRLTVECIEKLQSSLKEEADKAQLLLNSSHDKAVKWCTCQLKYPCSDLDAAFIDLIEHLEQSHKNHAALPVASAVSSRTKYLLGGGQKSHLFLEAERRKTFVSWPHKEYRWAYPEAMAKAGFYHQPTNRGDDRALCFTCNVCLVCWEPTDEPWSEHERHCPECSFVRGDHTKNVPMSVSLATALAYGHEGTQIKLISDSSCSHYIAACSEGGQVIIWDIQEELKIHSEFQVKLPAEAVGNQDGNSSINSGPPTSFVAWAEPENEELNTVSKEQESNLKSQNEPVEIGSDFSDIHETGTIKPDYSTDENHSSQGKSDCTKDAKHPAQHNNKENLVVCTISIVCSCGKDPTITAGQKCQSFRHTATLILALSITSSSLSTAAQTDVKDEVCLRTETQSCTYLMVYDVLTAQSETYTKPVFNVDNSIELEKEMMLQDPYTPSSSEDDWMYEQITPALSDTLHSSVLQKFAEAMSGEENSGKNKNKKSKEESHKATKLVQCLDLSEICKGQHCKVSEIVPFGNGQNLLVNLVCSGSSDNKTDIASTDVTCNEAKIAEQASLNHQKEEILLAGSGNQKTFLCNHSLNQTKLAVYRIVCCNGERTLSCQPLRTKQFSVSDGILSNLVVLPVETHPLLIDSEEQEAELSSASQLFVGAANCNVIVMHANSLDVLCKFTAGNEILHVLNCPGMDCFCACTRDGKMHFLGLRNQLPTETDLGAVECDWTNDVSEISPGGTASQPAVALSPDRPISLDSLISLVQLTEFVTLMPRFTASVPSSWFEVQQDQQRLHQHTLLDPVLHTRTWKLRSDNSSYLAKEKVVELVLPRYCHVGHVDIRFSLSPMTTQPTTNVYLLKPTYPSSFKSNNKAFAPSLAENQKKVILSSAQQQDTIICGPVNLKLGLDSTGRHGRVSLASPHLIKSSSRILLIVFDSCGTSEDLSEVSITVTRFKNNSPPDCHKLRSSLLEGSVTQLLDIVVSSKPVQGAIRVNDGRKLALELLCWMAGVWLNCNTRDTTDNVMVLEVESYLPKLIHTCYLSCGRSIAHKCTRMLMMCARKAVAHRSTTNSTSSFRRSLLDAILDVLRKTPCALSSGAVHWVFKLLTGFAAQANATLTSFVCLELLEFLSTKLSTARFPEHLVLRSRYGLYGCPLDPVLFNAVPQTSTSQQNSPIASNLVMPSLTQKGVPPPSTVSFTSEQESWSSASSSLACQGLLEVQPLHFVCCSTSDGARIERADVSQVTNSLGPTGASTIPLVSSGAPMPLPAPLPTVSASLAALEQELQMLKVQQQQHQLASLQQHKQQLEKHKKELADLSMWSLFPKFLSKVGDSNTEPWFPPSTLMSPFPPPVNPPMTSTTAPINLAQEKKQGGLISKQEKASPAIVSQPVQQHVLQLPHSQMLVIDRLHAGARHHVVIDFGCVVQLTDVLIPQCADIMSLSIDVWLVQDDPDAQRLAVLSDINLSACVLKDLLPPPVCRFVKLTVVGRPKNNAKARVRIGEFYGHPWCGQFSIDAKTQLLDAGYHDHQCLPVLHNLLEDIHCHYNLTCTQLRNLLQSAEPKSAITDEPRKGTCATEEEKKVHKAYTECMSLQHQLNLVERCISRLTSNTECINDVDSLDNIKYDQLQVICNCLVDTLVALMGVGPSLDGYLAKPKLSIDWQSCLSQVTPVMCENLFRNLCVHGSPQKRERVGALLLNACGNRPWWGEFLSGVLKEFFSSNQKGIFPHERLFAVLVSLSQQSPSIEVVLTSFLNLLDELLLLKDLKVDIESLDMTLVGWLLLLLAHVLDNCIVQSKPPKPVKENGDNSKASNGKSGGSTSSSKSKSSKPPKGSKSSKRSRWDFMLPMPATQPAGSASDSGVYGLQRHIKMSKLKGNGKQAYKHMKDWSKLRRHGDEGKTQPEKSAAPPSVFLTTTPLPANTTVPVIRKMISFMLSMNSACSVELFLTACKVVAHLSCVSEPRVCLVDVVTDDQLEQLLRMCVMPNGSLSSHWGGPWATHALTSLLQDLLQGGAGNKTIDTPKPSVGQGPEIRENVPEGSLMASTLEPKEKTYLLDIETSDFYEEYELPSEGELHAPGWIGEYIDMTNGSDMPQPTPVHEKPAMPPAWEAKVCPPPIKLSSAIDMRLDLGLEMEAEQDLKMLEYLQADAIARALSPAASLPRGTNERARKPVERKGNTFVAEKALQSAFCNIFKSCGSPEVDIVALLDLWLKIQLCCNGLKLDTISLKNMLSHLSNQGTSSAQAQRLCLQVLTVISGQQLKNTADAELLAFLSNEDLLKFLVKLLCQIPPDGSHYISPSPKPVKSFLVCLQSVADVDVKVSLQFRELLLKTVLQLCTKRLSNRVAVLQLHPVIDILMADSKVTWHQANLDIIASLISASVELCLEYLAHKQSVSLLPSADILLQSATGPGVDKLDNSSWLFQLLGLIIQILQKSKPNENHGTEPLTESSGETHQDSTAFPGSRDDCTRNSRRNLADKLVATKDVLVCLLECLNHFSLDKLGMFNSTPEKLSCDVKLSVRPTSVEEGVLQLLSVLQSNVSKREVLLDGILAYLQASKLDKEGSKFEAAKHLSDPLLWIIFKVLESSQEVTKFCEKGGLNIVCKSIVSGQTSCLDSSPSGLLSVMHELSRKTNRKETRKGLTTTAADTDCARRIVNFAPYGTISCPSSPRHPPDALLKAATQHRRARSAAWSYRFPLNEEWCDLTVSLPTAILLHEVHIQPHTTGLSTCPSHVSLDISNDTQVLVPVCEPVLTAGITVVKLKLHQPKVAQHVHIHCHCPRDSHLLGLSQIKVLGMSLRGSQNLGTQEVNLKGQAVSLGWVRLLGHCLSKGSSFCKDVKEPCALLTDVFNTCISLLLSPQSDTYSACVEMVLMKLSEQFPDLGTMLVRKLLKFPGDNIGKRRPVVNVSTVELIYQLGKKRDSSYEDRLSVMSLWLASFCDSSVVSILSAPGHIQAIAAVIWQAKETDAESRVEEHFPETLFRSLYNWSQNVTDQDSLKQSIDHLIASLCYVCPSYYDFLLELTGTVEVLRNCAKKSGGTNKPLSSLLSSPSRLETLATASQSCITSQMLLYSGLLELMVDEIVKFCEEQIEDSSSSKSEQVRSGVHPNILPHLLRFLTSCCRASTIADWMGADGFRSWISLLSKLSGGPSDHRNQTPIISSYDRFAIEAATVELFRICVNFHPRNQEQMAQLLVDALDKQDSLDSSSISKKGSQVSSFMRQLFLQMLLEEETVPMCLNVENELNLQTFRGVDFFHQHDWHPRFGAGHSFVLLNAKLSWSLKELAQQILLPKLDKPNEPIPEEKTSKPVSVEGIADPNEFGLYEGFEFLESVSLVAGLNVKSKRTEKSEAQASRESNPASVANQNQTNKLSCSFYHEEFGEMPLPQSWTLAQLLRNLLNRGFAFGSSVLKLSCRTLEGKNCDDSPSTVSPLLTSLDIFAKHDGLAKISMHLPCHTIMPSTVDSLSDELSCSEIGRPHRVPPYPTRLPLPLVSLPASVLSTVPAHSLVAFGLFIRLPGYDKALLQDRLRARYLLRLLLGAKQDGNGEAILSSPVASSLATLPFQVLCILFQTSAVSPQECMSVQRAAIEVGAIQMVLLCLAVLSHHKPRATNHSHKLALQALSALTGSVCRDSDLVSGNERSYWAKGTGFGTGPTSSGWDVEQAMLKQKAEEEHVTCLLQVLASYIRPFRKDSRNQETESSQSSSERIFSVPEQLLGLLEESCLIPALSSYLRNDSVLDMARHVPLYQAVLEVLRAVALCPVLLPLLLPQSNGLSRNDGSSSDTPCIVSLLEKMKHCVDTYSKTLRSTQGKKEGSNGSGNSSASNATAGPSTAAEQSTTSVPSIIGGPSSVGQAAQSQGTGEDKKDPEAEGLAQLIPDIQETAKLTQKLVQEFNAQQSSCNKIVQGAEKDSVEQPTSLSSEEKYLARMRPLQFGTHKIVLEKEGGKVEFDSGGYHFASSVRSAATSGGSGGMVRARRLAQEVSSLATSLPLSYSSSVFVRCDKERLDVMKVLITGPSDTPYANGCFEFDVYFPQNYPESPMYVNFETTGHHSIRFNPNLYNDGKVCLSILNTWHGRPEEKWNPQNSSFLQVLVSIQSLILVHEPYFNEPGYERSRGTPAGQQNSREYDANICQATVRWAMLEQLKKPSPCFKQVIQAHFYFKKDEILAQCEQWIKDSESLLSGRTVGRAISHHVQSLKQNTALLKQELAKLEPPPEHIPEDEDTDGDSD